MIKAHMTSSVFGVYRGASLVTHRAKMAESLQLSAAPAFCFVLVESDPQLFPNYFIGPAVVVLKASTPIGWDLALFPAEPWEFG